MSESLSDSSDNSFSENVSKASLSLKELIENAKKKIENSCEKISREDEEEARRVAQKRIDEQADAMNIEVSVPNYSIYDTHNIQEELAKNVKNLFEDEQEETEEKVTIKIDMKLDVLSRICGFNITFKRGL